MKGHQRSTKKDRILEMHTVLALEKFASRAGKAAELARVHAGDAAEESSSSSSETEMSRAAEVSEFRTERYVCEASGTRRARRVKFCDLAVPTDEPVVAPNVTNARAVQRGKGQGRARRKASRVRRDGAAAQIDSSERQAASRVPQRVARRLRAPLVQEAVPAAIGPAVGRRPCDTIAALSGP